MKRIIILSMLTTLGLSTLMAQNTLYIMKSGTVIYNQSVTNVDSIIFYKPSVATIDYDGNIYKTVQIGTQTRMAENLKTTRYSNGDLIGTISGNITDEIAPKYQWASNNSEIYVSTFGRLYTWYAVTDIRNVCPIGWHIPIDSEWNTLDNYLITAGYNYDGTGTGKKYAKALASAGWNLSSTVGAIGNIDFPAKINKTGFTALPAGIRMEDGGFSGIGERLCYWSASEVSTSDGSQVFLYFNNNVVIFSGLKKQRGFSVRCIKD